MVDATRDTRNVAVGVMLCYLAVLLAMIAVLWLLFAPGSKELVVLSLWAGSVICQFRVAKLMSDEGVADPVTSLIFAVFLVPILYVIGWLYAKEWGCRQLMVIWSILLASLTSMLILF